MADTDSTIPRHCPHSFQRVDFLPDTGLIRTLWVPCHKKDCLCQACRGRWETRQAETILRLAKGSPELWLRTLPLKDWSRVRRRLKAAGAGFAKTVTAKDRLAVLSNTPFKGAEPVNLAAFDMVARGMTAASLPRTHLTFCGTWKPNRRAATVGAPCDTGPPLAGVVNAAFDTSVLTPSPAIAPG